MHSVYVLKSLKDGRTYTGYSSDLKKRLLEHNSMKVNATKKRVPFEIVFWEDLETLELAKKRELYWKSGAGRRRLKNIFSAGSRPSQLGRGSLKIT